MGPPWPATWSGASWSCIEATRRPDAGRRRSAGGGPVERGLHLGGEQAAAGDAEAGGDQPGLEPHRVADRVDLDRRAAAGSRSQPVLPPAAPPPGGGLERVGGDG